MPNTIPAASTITLWTTSQNPHVARLVISAFIGVAPEHKLRVIAPDVGGGFGSKIFIYPEEVVCLWASKKVGRPVKWTADRSEAFITDAHGRDHVTHAEMAFDANNKIVGLRVKTIANLGAYMSTFSSAVPTYLYATLALRPVRHSLDLLRGGFGLYQHRAGRRLSRSGAAGSDLCGRAPDGSRARAQLGVDPADLRKKNFVKKFPYQTVVASLYDAGDYHASLTKAMEIHDVKGFNKRKRESARNGKLRGIGYSTYIEACGVAPSAVVGSLGAGVGLWESAEVRVNPTG